MELSFIFQKKNLVKREFTLFSQNLNEKEIKEIIRAEKRPGEKLIEYKRI